MKHLTILLLLLSSLTYGQGKSVKTDSSEAASIVSDFYSWYIESVNKGNLGEYSPVIVEGENGTTTLSFDKYIRNLKTNHFYDSLINAEKQTYNLCLKNLN